MPETQGAGTPMFQSVKKETVANQSLIFADITWLTLWTENAVLTEAFLVLVRTVKNPSLLLQPMLLTSETFTKFHHMRGDKIKARTLGKANWEATFLQIPLKKMNLGVPNN